MTGVQTCALPIWKYKNSFDYIETYLKEKDGKTLMKKGYVLTDDKSPVELLGMKLLDNLIQKELEFFKDFNLKELLTNLNWLRCL